MTTSSMRARRIQQAVVGLAVGSCLLAVAACSGGSGDSGSELASGGTLLDAAGISMRAESHKVS